MTKQEWTKLPRPKTDQVTPMGNVLTNVTGNEPPRSFRTPPTSPSSQLTKKNLPDGARDWIP